MNLPSNDDRLIQGMAWSGGFRIIAAQTTYTVETAREIFDLSPVAAAALGRALTGAVLLARLLDKNVRSQSVTLRFSGDGPLGLLIAEGTVGGGARGYVQNPTVVGSSSDVGSAVGSDGLLTVIRGVPPDGKPYTSQVRLVSGEIAKDLAHYLASSEQIASAVLLGVMNRRTGVASAGGMIIQAFPHVSEKAVEQMERHVRDAPSFSSLLEKMSLEDAVQHVLKGTDYKAIDPSFNIPIGYRCTCTRERALTQFGAFSPQELAEIIAEGKSEATCQFCGRRYTFTGDELLALGGRTDAS